MTDSISKRIRILRTAHAFTQEQIAEKLNISVERYSGIEKGSLNISLNILEKLVKIYDVNIRDLTEDFEDDPVLKNNVHKDPTAKIFYMLDLFYANKHLREKLKCKQERKENYDHS